MSRLTLEKSNIIVDTGFDGLAESKLRHTYEIAANNEEPLVMPLHTALTEFTDVMLPATPTRSPALYCLKSYIASLVPIYRENEDADFLMPNPTGQQGLSLARREAELRRGAIKLFGNYELACIDFVAMINFVMINTCVITELSPYDLEDPRLMMIDLMKFDMTPPLEVERPSKANEVQ